MRRIVAGTQTMTVYKTHSKLGNNHGGWNGALSWLVVKKITRQTVMSTTAKKDVDCQYAYAIFCVLKAQS